ncbi:MAG TPA: transglycosylase domain-containing protein [Candidatus Dormibacteraeota bacterium]|jgi:membrane peptidoglycan carboxypeptidase|nr:transglycosylase domain-containing protein [Candidatus Dormibacteraeota bacterium]
MGDQQLAAVRGRRRRRRLRRGRVFSTFLALVLVGTFSVAAEALDQYQYYTLDLPDPSSLNPYDLQQATQILDRNGKLLYLKHGNEIRTVVPLDRIAPVLRQATIDLEDKNFYQHHGLDYNRLLGAAYNNVFKGGAQGGSTITQQLVKRKYLTLDQTLDRKVKEALLASEIEQRYSKDQILEAYLNEIFYGHQAYGIDAAAQTYFGKHAADLDLSEATLLAGIPEEPSTLDPLTEAGLKLCRERQKTVLQAMVNQGDITQAQAIQVEQAPIKLNPQVPDQVLVAPHFVAYVLDYLRQRYGSNLVDGGGLKVTTSLDLDLQTKAEDIVRKRVASYGSVGINNGAMEVLNPNTGEILAYVGSSDYNNKAISGSVDNISNVGGSARQPGSSFKPYVYLTAFADGYSPSSIIDDTQGPIAGFTFHDFDNRSTGNITLRKALVESRNIPAIKLLQALGYSRVFQTARTLGITTDLKPELGTAIGSSGLHMLDHVSAYGVFATQGIYRPPAPVIKIQDANGNQIFSLKDTGKRVASQQVTYMLNDVLLGYPKQWSLSFPGPTAGKSGTTEDGADLWYMAYTPDLVVGTWMAHTGNKPDGTPIGRYPLPGQFGVTTASHMAEDFLKIYYTGGHTIPTFQKPSGIQTPCPAPPRPSPAPAQPGTTQPGAPQPGQPGGQQGTNQDSLLANAAEPPASPSPGASPRPGSPGTCSTSGDIKIEGT